MFYLIQVFRVNYWIFSALQIWNIIYRMYLMVVLPVQSYVVDP